MWSNDAHLELPVQQLSCQSYPENTHTHTQWEEFLGRGRNKEVDKGYNFIEPVIFSSVACSGALKSIRV